MTLQGEGEAQSSCATKPPRANFTVVAAMQLSSCCILIVGGEGGGEKGKKREGNAQIRKFKCVSPDLSATLVLTVPVQHVVGKILKLATL